MAQEKTEGVVLRGTDFSETSRVVTLLTPDRGRVTVMAKGVRRKGSALAGVLDTFHRVEFVYYWKAGREVQTLAEASVADRYPQLKSDFERGAWAAFPLEIAGRLAHDNEPSAPLYAALVRGLEGMNRSRVPARAHAVWQALQLLGSAGFAPELGQCHACGNVIGDAAGFTWDGGVVCGTCRADRRLTPKLLAALRRIAAAEAACPADTDMPELYKLIRQYAAYQLDTGFKSTRVLDELFG